MPSKRLMALMDDDEKSESRKERQAEKKNPKLELKEKKMVFKKAKAGKK